MKVDTVIVGAGSAGLSALREVRRYTDETIRKAYDDWWQALGWVREGLIAGGMLWDVEVSGAMPKASVSPAGNAANTVNGQSPGHVDQAGAGPGARLKVRFRNGSELPSHLQRMSRIRPFYRMLHERTTAYAWVALG